MTFPSTPILDNFNRANEGPPPSAAWDSNVAWFGTAAALETFNNACRQAQVGSIGGAFYKTLYGQDQEGRLKITASKSSSGRHSGFGLYARANSASGTITDLYEFLGSTYDNNLDQTTFEINRFNSIAGWTNLGLVVVNVILSIGDQIGYRCVGSALEFWYCPDGGAWSVVLSATDSNLLSGGYIGVEIFDPAITNPSQVAAFDDFGGGSIPFLGKYSTPFKNSTLSLDQFRSVFSLQPFHFWQLADSTIIPVDANCSDLVYEYAYQSGVNNAVGRADIRNAIEAATLKMQEHLGFSPVPHFVSPDLINPSPDAMGVPRFYDATQYRSNYVGADSRWLTIQLPEGKIRQIGAEKFTLLGTVNTIAYSDSDSDGLIDLATLTLYQSALIDTDSVECYFSNRNGDVISAEWIISPVLVAQDSNSFIVSIKIPAWVCVPPQSYQSVLPTPLNPTTSAIFTNSIDVYLHTCDPTGTTTDDCQAVLIWETTPYPGWATVCFNCDLNFNNSRDPAAVAYAIARVGVRDAQAGIVYFGEAIYNTTSQQWLSQPMSNCRPPDRILIRYYAGDSLANWQKTLANLSAAELGKRVCACSSANEMIYQQQIDRADNSSSKIDQFNLSQDDLGNPLGSKTGQIYAWKQIRHLRYIGGVRLP